MRITVDLLRDERRHSVAVKFEEFMRIYSKQKDSIICFFEGYDQAYYHSRIDNLIDGKTAYLNCGGKQQVRRLHQTVGKHSIYKDAKTAFFIDRDFDNPIPTTLKSDIYETPVYSIENFYVSLDAFERIMDNIFRINKYSDENDEVEIHKTCLKLYKTIKRKFHEKSTLLNVFIMVLRKKKTLKSTKHSLKILKIKNLIQIGMDNVQQNYDLETLNNLFPGAETITQEEISSIKIPPHKEQGKAYRGKFEISFLQIFLELLKQQLCSKTSTYFPCRKKISFNIPSSIDGFLNDLSQWADTPECLTQYLTQINIKYSTF